MFSGHKLVEGLCASCGKHRVVPFKSVYFLGVILSPGKPCRCLSSQLCDDDVTPSSDDITTVPDLLQTDVKVMNTSYQNITQIHAAN